MAAKTHFVGILQKKTETSITVDGVTMQCNENVRQYLPRYTIGKKVYIDLDPKNVKFIDDGDKKDYEKVPTISSYVGSSVSDDSTPVGVKIGLKEKSIIWEHHMTSSIETIKTLLAAGVLDYSGGKSEDMVRDVVAMTEIFFQCTMTKLDGGDPLSRWKE